MKLLGQKKKMVLVLWQLEMGFRGRFLPEVPH